MSRCGELGERFRQLGLHRLRQSREDGFILLESVIAITVITIVMGAVGVEFVGGMIITNAQRVQQSAVQVASSTVEQLRALDPSDLVTGRGSSSVDGQFASTLAALPAVQPWLSTMDKVSDPKAAATSGIAAAVPTCGTAVVAGTCQKTPGNVVYTVNQYLGSCLTRTGVEGDCAKAASVSSRDAVKYLRAVVAVTWDGPRCGTGCSFVTSTLISSASDPTFRINSGPYAAPVVVAKPDQTVVVGDVVSLQMSVADGKGVPPFTWAVSSGSLPAGLVLNPSTGLISGTVAGPAGDYPSRITVTDAFIRSDSEDVAWKVLQPLVATVPAAQSSVVSTPLSPPLQLQATGGSGTYTWSDSSSRTLPAGLTLTPAGLISGTPTTPGSSTVVLTVTSAGATRTISFSWNVVRLAGASYDFEEGAGTTTADGTGNNNTATLQPGAGWTNGKVNTKALGLTGASDSWAAAPNPVIDTSQSFTAASWVRFSSLGGYQTMVSVDGTNIAPFYLQKADDGRFRFAFYRNDGTSSSYGLVQGVAPTTDAWYHVAGVFDQAAGTVTLYVDGVSQGVVSGVSMFRATGATTIGRAKFDGRPVDFLNGAVDDTRLYPRALSATEIATLASGGAAGPTGGSVTATGLTGTAGRYSTRTNLSLVLAKGNDPNGLAATGAQLYRATATLTGGTCGTYGAYGQIGPNDPGTPFADAVADGACYSYRYRVVDTLGNASTYVSQDIKVDTSAPAAPTLGFSAFSNTSSTGSTLYYRPGATSGEFTVTASSTDPVAGIASYAFPGLGTGWTATPGAQGVTTYSWSAANPAVPGTPTVTATNNAGTPSTGTALTVTRDSTAPGGVTLTYASRSGPSTSVNLDLITGTDSGSGIGTALLQRASAPLTGSTCGTYTGYSTVSGGTNPASSFSDTVTTGSCYKYQYVVSDRVGNTTTVTGTNVVKVRPTYAQTIEATAGLLNWFRLGDDALTSDTFTDTADRLLTSHTGEIGATWTAYLGSNLAKVSSANRLYRSGTGTTGYYTSATPATADYSVQADLVFRSNITNDYAGVIGRANTATATFYGAGWEQQSSNGGRWVLYKSSNGTVTTLNSASATSRTAGQTNRIELEMIGSAIKLYVDGVLTVSATDATITAAGRGGIYDGNPSATVPKTDTTGIQYDNFSILGVPDPRVSDSKGSNVGDYFNGVVLGVVGAIDGDANTAATFDGINDYATVTRTIQDDFAIEFWFKSTGGFGTGGQWYNAAGLVDAEVAGGANDFGVGLRSDGRVIAGAGAPDTSIISSTAGYNNGAWHHVVFNRVKGSGALQLFVDGASAGTATGPTASLTGPATINFGRSAAGNNYLAGSLDEVALYNTVLSPATVTAHYSAGQ